MISFRHKGNYSKATRYFERLREVVRLGVLDKYGRAGVDALSSATPVDSGRNREFVGLRNRTFGWVVQNHIYQFTH